MIIERRRTRAPRDTEAKIQPCEPGDPLQSPPPAFSVVMPVYNMEHRGLCNAIESVQSQTFTDWELLIVDDGSTDGSGAIADRYAAQDPRIRVRHQPNGGISVARNAGYQMARGDHVSHLDGDDEYLPEALALQAAAFREHPGAGVVFGYRRTDDGSVGINCPPSPECGRWQYVHPRNCMPCQSVSVRRSLLQLAGGNDPEPPVALWAEDWEQWARLVAVSELHLVPAPLYWLHGTQGSITRTRTGTPIAQDSVRIIQERIRALMDARARVDERPLRLVVAAYDAYARGAQVMILSLLRRLPPERFEVRLLFRDMDGELLDEFSSRWPVARLADRGDEWLRWADVVHWHFWGWRSPVDIERLAAGRLVVTQHNLQALYTCAGRRVDVWNSEPPRPDADLPRALGPRTIEIANPVDLPALPRRRLVALEEGPLILGLFPAQEAKGADVWMDAAERVHAQRPDCQFLICGARPAHDGWFDRLLERVDRMQARGVRVSWLPPQGRDVVRELCQRAAALMHLSRTEAQSLAILEAQACGTPVVATRTAGIPQSVYSGRLVPVGDAEAAAREVLSLLSTRVDKTTRERIADRHSPERCAAAYTEVYTHVALQRRLEVRK